MMCDYETENGQKYHLIDGHLYDCQVQPDFLRGLPRLETRASDVYISTYPKAGTTWMEAIVWHILHPNTDDSERIDVRVPWLEKIGSAETVANLPSPRIFKTHLLYELVPKGTNESNRPKHICVIRNPKDSAVSYYNHYKAFTFLNYNQTWEHFFRLFIKGEVQSSSWFDHVVSWWNQRDKPNVLILKYEDMKKDLSDTVQKVASFLNKPLTTEQINKIALCTSFSQMKGNSAYSYAWYGRKEGSTAFVRKGKVGDWRNYFTEEQNQEFDTIFNERMNNSGLELDFGDD